jgi:hypothetical protein
MGDSAVPAEISAAAPVNVGRTLSAPFVPVPTTVQPEHPRAAEIAVIEWSAVPDAAKVDRLLPHLVVAKVRRKSPGWVVVVIGVTGGVGVISIGRRRCSIIIGRRRCAIIIGRRLIAITVVGRRWRSVLRRCSVRIRTVITLCIGRDRKCRSRSGHCDCRYCGLGHASHFLPLWPQPFAKLSHSA